MEELGGAHVHRRNGQVDAVANSLDEVYSLIRQALSYLPTAGGMALPLTAASTPRATLGAGPFAIGDVLDAVFDAGPFFEIKPDYSPSVITAFARMNGVPVGVVASNRAVDDGVIGSRPASKWPGTLRPATRSACRSSSCSIRRAARSTSRPTANRELPGS